MTPTAVLNGHHVLRDSRDTLELDTVPEETGPDQAGGHQGHSGHQGESAEQVPARRTSWTAAELMTQDFPAPRWAVPGLICEGITLLAGPPKVGKSWLSLGLGVAVATGGLALGTIPVAQGDVLYLALEDTARRLKSRLEKVLGDTPPPAGLTLVTECSTLTSGGDVQIVRWIDAHPDARLIVIDVFAKVRGTPPQGVSMYDADYAAIGRVKRIADHFGIAIVLVHHVRKMGSEDFLAEVSGTNGIAGAADAVLVLKRGRGQGEGVLHVTGRDIDESEYPAAFDPDTGSWNLSDGPAAAHNLGEVRQAILTHLRAHPESTPRQISDALNSDYENTKKTVRRMLEDGQVVSTSRGHYSAPGPA